MTKGFTQSGALAAASNSAGYDAVAFQKFRPRLLDTLQAIGLMPGAKSIDPYLTAEESNYGFASIIRCSMAGWGAKSKPRNRPDERTEYAFLSRSSAVIAEMKRPEGQAFLEACLTRNVATMGRRTRLVVLLSNDSNYINMLTNVIKDLPAFRDFEQHPNLPSVYKASNRFFVHTAHPSPLNGRLSEFVAADPTTVQGRKCLEARRGVQGALGTQFGQI
jgi:hypothetical protein